MNAELFGALDETSARLRAFDWSSSRLGPPESWPTSLRTIVGVVLCSRDPMLVWWGRDLVQIHNDGCRPLLGARHSVAQAMPGPTAWPEIWPIAAPIADRILAGGLACRHEMILAPARPARRARTLVFSFSPVPDDGGAVGGVVVTVQPSGVRDSHRARLDGSGVPLTLTRGALEQHLHELFMQAPILVAVLRGPDFVVDVANQRVCHAWGCEQITLTGKPLLQAVPGLRGHGFEALLEDVYRTGTPRDIRELAFRLRPDEPDTLKYFNFVYSPFKDAGGRVAGVFVLGSDVTDQVRARQQLDELRRTAESANRAKDEFLAMLGHELRNPLSPIVTALQLMKLRGDSSDRERTVIERQVAHLTRLVDDLLDVSRIARGKVELKIECVEVADVVVKAIEMASPLLEQRGHALELDVPRRGLPVKADGTRLAQVVSNLLTNAAKYTPGGGRIGVHAARDGDGMVLRVRDNGIGISPEVLSRVFDLFVQERQGLDRAHGGLGLGLTIVRNLVQLHGGTVSAASAGMGKGSQFEVRLPLAIEPLPVVEAVDGPRAPEVPPVHRRVLVVDDNHDSASMLAEALRLRGHDVRVANDGPAALAASATFKPHVAFLDIGLPVMDGYELAARLRQLPGQAGLRLLALTGYGQESDSARSRAAGFHEHLVKPLDLSHLDRLLNPPDDAAPAR